MDDGVCGGYWGFVLSCEPMPADLNGECVMFLVPLREIDLFGVFVTPAFIGLLLATALFVVFHVLAARIDLNRFVWNRPLFEVTLFFVTYALAILTMTEH